MRGLSAASAPSTETLAHRPELMGEHYEAPRIERLCSTTMAPVGCRSYSL
jgi:hypothetical protein